MALAGENVVVSFGSTVAHVLSGSGPNPTRQTIDTTDLDSTAREFRVSALKDGGEVSLTVQYDPSSHTSVLGKLDDSTASSTVITLNDADGSAQGSFSFDSFLTGYNITGVGLDGNIQAELTLKITGDVEVA